VNEMKYYRREGSGEAEVISREAFIQGMRDEFAYGPSYYEYVFLLLGRGDKLVGSIHLYWVEWE